MSCNLLVCFQFEIKLFIVHNFQFDICVFLLCLLCIVYSLHIDTYILFSSFCRFGFPLCL